MAWTFYFQTGLFDDIKTNIDERCFIETGIGQKKILRSLIHREHFISYNKDTDKFVMKEIPMKLYRAYINGIISDNPADRQTEDYISAVAELNDCWFDFSTPSFLDQSLISSTFTSFFVCGSSHSGRSIQSNMPWQWTAIKWY